MKHSLARKIEITPGFLAMVCLIGWLDMSVCICFLIAVMIHELSHLITAVLHGGHVERIVFRCCGAVIQTQSMSYTAEIYVALAGPLANIVTTLIAKNRYGQFAVISLLLAIVNLLPIYPMDGGRMLRSALLLCVTPAVAGKILRITAFLVCGVLMLAACWYTAVCQAGLWPVFASLAILWRAGEAGTQEPG